MAETNPTPLRDILQYEPLIGAAADPHIAARIKQSILPDFTMLFFPLVMRESRLRSVISPLEGEDHPRENNQDGIHSHIEFQPK